VSEKKKKKKKKKKKGKKAAHGLCGVPLPLLALGQQPRHLGTDLGNFDAQLPKVVPVMTNEEKRYGAKMMWEMEKCENSYIRRWAPLETIHHCAKVTCNEHGIVPPNVDVGVFLIFYMNSTHVRSRCCRPGPEVPAVTPGWFSVPLWIVVKKSVSATVQQKKCTPGTDWSIIGWAKDSSARNQQQKHKNNNSDRMQQFNRSARPNRKKKKKKKKKKKYNPKTPLEPLKHLKTPQNTSKKPSPPTHHPLLSDRPIPGVDSRREPDRGHWRAIGAEPHGRAQPRASAHGGASAGAGGTAAHRAKGGARHPGVRFVCLLVVCG
jgi:hypothetical protein